MNTGWVFAAAGVSLLLALGLYLKNAAIRVENPRMAEISGYIREGAMAYLKRQYLVMSLFVLVMFLVLALALNFPTAICFTVGALFSILSGFFGMMSATRANVRTAQSAKNGMSAALKVAFSGGAVLGLSVVGLGALGLAALYLIFDGNIDTVTGFSLGASSIALFARVGGGIYTKAADVGRLGVDAAADAGEQGDRAGAQREAGHGVDVAVKDQVEGRQAEGAQADHRQAEHRAAGEGDLERRAHAVFGALGRADVGARRAHHSEEAGEDREQRPDREADRRREVERQRQHQEHHQHKKTHHQILTLEIGHRALADVAGDLRHARIFHPDGGVFEIEPQCQQQTDAGGGKDPACVHVVVPLFVQKAKQRFEYLCKSTF